VKSKDSHHQTLFILLASFAARISLEPWLTWTDLGRSKGCDRAEATEDQSKVEEKDSFILLLCTPYTAEKLRQSNGKQTRVQSGLRMRSFGPRPGEKRCGREVQVRRRETEWERESWSLARAEH
jgi:hypothetical protein